MLLVWKYSEFHFIPSSLASIQVNLFQTIPNQLNPQLSPSSLHPLLSLSGKHHRMTH
jgi:hypothetical protein